MKGIVRYLQALKIEAPNLGTRQWERTIAIPICDEPDLIERPLFSSLDKACNASQVSSLVIAILNNSAANSAIWNKTSGCRVLSNDVRLQDLTSSLSILWVDRFSQDPITNVGTARKFAVDLALRLFVQGHLKDGISCLDADCFVDEDYFEPPKVDRTLGLGRKDLKVYVHDYHHINFKDSVSLAQAKYDDYLKENEARLIQAASPYAFTALGSILQFPFVTYCTVGGFPKLSAGEDFYFLNKVVKMGTLHFTRTKVHIHPRISKRTPFGTGQAIAQILEGKIFKPYSKEAFHLLKRWQEILLKPEEWSDSLTLGVERRVLTGLKKISNSSHPPRTKQYLAHCLFDGLRTHQFLRRHDSGF